MPNLDPRKIVGNKVTTKAKLITSDSECRRLYGALWKTTTVTGTVTNVETILQNNRRQCHITANYQLQNRQKSVTLKLVHIRHAPTTEPIQNNIERQLNPTTATNLVYNYNSSDEDSDDQIQQNQNDQPSNVTNNRNITIQDEIKANEYLWKPNDDNSYVNGRARNNIFKVTGPVGDYITERYCPAYLTPFDFFLWMFPIPHLGDMVDATNHYLTAKNLAETSVTEVLRFFGIIILLTRYEFSDRRSLWSVTNVSKYIPSPEIGKIMSRSRFENLRSLLKFNGSPRLNNSNDRWFPVRNFVNAVNIHRQCFVSPSQYLCIDESMSRWYGLGGDWMDIGLPHYVALERKPENGCEIKSVADGVTGIMLNLEIVECAEASHEMEYASDNKHGTAVTMRLTEPWFYSDRIVCGDAFFSSCETAVELYKKGLRYIGVVKNATYNYPMRYLSTQPMNNRGDCMSLMHESTVLSAKLLAVMWIDRDRRYFISTCKSTTQSSSFERERWRMVNGRSQKVTQNIGIPDVCRDYYSCCAQVDRHNRYRQDDLDIEKKIEVKDWEFRVNSTLLAICIVDSYQLYLVSRGDRAQMSPHVFFTKLSEELIDNEFQGISRRSSTGTSNDGNDANLLDAGTGINLQQTNRKRKLANGIITNAIYQSRCKICKGTKKSKFICSECKKVHKTEVFLCHTGTGRCCFKEHVTQCHDVEI